MAAPAGTVDSVDGGKGGSLYRNQTFKNTGNNSVAGGGSVNALQALGTKATDFAIDPTLGDNVSVTLSGAATITISQTTPTAPIEGQWLSILFITSGTSAFVATFGTGFKSSGVLNTGGTDAKQHVVSFRCINGVYTEHGRVLNM